MNCCGIPQRNFDIYKGADFVLNFRFSAGGEYIDPDTLILTFRAKSGSTLYEYISTDSPSYFAADEDYIVEFRLPGLVTEEFEAGQIPFELDSEDEDGEIKRRMIGSLTIYESVADE